MMRIINSPDTVPQHWHIAFFLAVAAVIIGNNMDQISHLGLFSVRSAV